MLKINFEFCLTCILSWLRLIYLSLILTIPVTSYSQDQELWKVEIEFDDVEIVRSPLFESDLKGEIYLLYYQYDYTGRELPIVSGSFSGVLPYRQNFKDHLKNGDIVKLFYSGPIKEDDSKYVWRGLTMEEVLSLKFRIGARISYTQGGVVCYSRENAYLCLYDCYRPCVEGADYFEVEMRKYRTKILNSTADRSYSDKLEATYIRKNREGKAEGIVKLFFRLRIKKDNLWPCRNGKMIQNGIAIRDTIRNGTSLINYYQLYDIMHSGDFSNLVCNGKEMIYRYNHMGGILNIDFRSDEESLHLFVGGKCSDETIITWAKLQPNQQFNKGMQAGTYNIFIDGTKERVRGIFDLKVSTILP